MKKRNKKINTIRYYDLINKIYIFIFNISVLIAITLCIIQCFITHFKFSIQDGKGG